MTHSEYKFVKDVQNRLTTGQSTTFGERNKMSIILKADAKRKAENARRAVENVQYETSSKRF